MALAYIYAYAPNEENCSTIGQVGALLDADAAFELQAGEFGELTFLHPIDAWGKWRALVNGAILKTMVPMRLCPEIDGTGGYIESVDEYAVSATATRSQRYIYSQRTGDRRKKLLRAGARVTVTGVADPSDAKSRYRVRCGGRLSGYMEREGLALTRRQVPVEGGPQGLEAVERSYAVRQQLFRIVEVRTDAEAGGRMRVRAYRIAYDLLGNVTTYSTGGNVSCQQACEGVLGGTVMPHGFNVYTDIGDTHVGFDARDKNPIEALLDRENGIAARWGADVVSDDFDIYLLRRAGMDRGVRIEYGKNLVGLEVSTRDSGVLSAIRPRGETKSGAPLYLDGHIVNGRHGYNYDSARRTCADWLPEGYRFYIGADGETVGSVVVREGHAAAALPRVGVIRVDDAKVEKGTAGVTASVARRRLAEAAVARFEAGCDRPELSMDVDFVLLGDTTEYRAYRHLESLFVYDTVRVCHGPLGIEAEIDLTSLRWLVREERVASAAFGALSSGKASIAGWQLMGGVSGGKLADGTVSGGALADDIIHARHVQAESIGTEALQAGSVTANKIAAGAVDAQSIAAVTARINSITARTISTDSLAAAFASLVWVAATNIQAEHVTADALDAALASIVTLTAGTGSFDVATVQNLVSSALSLEQGQADSMYITNLAITSANLLNAVVGRLVVKGEDGSYYGIGVGSDGTLRAAVCDITAEEIAAGEAADGRQIVEEAINAQSIAGQTVKAQEAVLGRLLTNALSAGSITAGDALLASASIPLLYATSIRALGDTIDISANRAITLLADNLNRVVRIDGEGLHVGDSQAASEVLIDSASVNVALGGVRYSKFAADYVQFGDTQLRRSVDGGLVFKKEG